MIKTKMRWRGHVECMEEKRNGNRILMVKLKVKNPLG
jgi:hypothetical protein